MVIVVSASSFYTDSINNDYWYTFLGVNTDLNTLTKNKHKQLKKQVKYFLTPLKTKASTLKIIFQKKTLSTILIKIKTASMETP